MATDSFSTSREDRATWLLVPLGVMTVMAAVVALIVAGVHVADTFTPGAAAAEVARDGGIGAATSMWATPLALAGIAAIFSGIAFALARIRQDIRGRRRPGLRAAPRPVRHPLTQRHPTSTKERFQMSTTATIESRIPNVEPYKGDDWAQSLSRLLATPMFLMGVMAVLTSLILGIAGGINIGEFFGAVGNQDFSDLGRAEVLGQWTGATAFLGMGFILSGVVMHLVNIVRTLRDAGRDVQTSLGAKPLKLRKPWTGQLTPHVMLMGVMVEVAAFITGIVAAVKIGSLNAAFIANPASGSSGDVADIGFVRAASTWLPGLRLAGLAILLGSVVLVLLTIQKTLRFQASRVTEIAEQSSRPVTTPAAADAVVHDLTTPAVNGRTPTRARRGA